MIKKLYPEDGPAFQRGLEQRRKQVDVERLVQNVAYERRQREAVAERSREATRKAKDARHVANMRIVGMRENGDLMRFVLCSVDAISTEDHLVV